MFGFQVHLRLGYNYLEPPSSGYTWVVFFLLVKPNKIIFLIQDIIHQKGNIILLYIGYHRTPI